MKKIVKKYSENGTLVVFVAEDLSKIRKDNDMLNIDLSKPVAASKLSALDLLANSMDLKVGSKLALFAMAIEDEVFGDEIEIPEETINGDKFVLQFIPPANIQSVIASGKISMVMTNYTVNEVLWTEDSTEIHKSIASIVLMPENDGEVFHLER